MATQTIELSRNINFDARLNRWVLDVLISGENEEFTYATQAEANSDYYVMRRNGASLISLDKDGSL